MSDIDGRQNKSKRLLTEDGKERRMKDKIKTAEEALACIQDGASIMIGGFAGVGVPNLLVDTLAERGVKDLTIIDCDAGRPNMGVGKLLRNGQVKKLICTHVGNNPECAHRTPDDPNMWNVEYELVPQGTFVERVKAGGSGLGGVITPVGVGTVVEEGKQKITLHGKDYIIEEPLRADVALIRAETADKLGNLVYHGAARNFNTTMAMAADYVVAGVENIVEAGELDPDNVVTQGILVDAIVGGEKKCRI